MHIYKFIYTRARARIHTFINACTYTPYIYAHRHFFTMTTYVSTDECTLVCKHVFSFWKNEKSHKCSVNRKKYDESEFTFWLSLLLFFMLLFYFSFLSFQGEKKQKYIIQVLSVRVCVPVYWFLRFFRFLSFLYNNFYALSVLLLLLQQQRLTTTIIITSKFGIYAIIHMYVYI